MRIITGKAKGMKLFTLEGEDITRPTAERVKEAIFSSLGADLEGTRVLDLFGGSGQLALEALSRGAGSAVVVDKNKKAIDIIKRNAQKTKLEASLKIMPCDYSAALSSLGSSKFDLVFLDPPYASDLLARSLYALSNSDLLAPGALVICESDGERPEIPEGLYLKKESKYGRTLITVLTNIN